MKGQIRILRQGRFVTFEGEYEANTPVIRILEELNERESLTDVDGNPAEKIMFESECRQKRCGACAMVINDVPRLACSTFFGEVGPEIELKPLSVFPLVKDLRVDRSSIAENLTTSQVWLDGKEARVNNVDLQYASSTCLHCGCCLEVCPDYTGHDRFFGAVWMNECWRIISQVPDAEKKKQLAHEFKTHGSSGCTKDLSCAKVCPVKVPLAAIISRGNRECFFSQLKKWI